MRPTARLPTRNSMRVLAALLATILVVTSGVADAAMHTPGHDGGGDGNDVAAAALRPHCSDFQRYCNYSTATDSCVFSQSVTFSCSLAAFNASRARNASSSTAGSGALEAVVGVDVGDVEPLVASPSQCRWELGGDLVVAQGVTVDVHGDDCFLQLAVGKMVLLSRQSALHASSIDIDASFVRLEMQSHVAATYSGVFKGQTGLFPGNATMGASNAGSGGLRVVGSPGPGFFNMKSVAVGRNDSDVIERARNAWDLSAVWEPDTVERDALLLFGSGSRVEMNESTATVVRGGGRIRIVASSDVVLMDGARVYANGGRAVNGVAAGSGGSVLVQASELSLTGRIEAKGGDAFCDTSGKTLDASACFPGGGGGRITVAYKSSQLSDDAIDVSGGTIHLDSKQTKQLRAGQLRALEGGPGTYFRVNYLDKGRADTTLTIDRRSPLTTFHPSGAVTSLSVNKHTRGSPVGSLVVNGGAIVAFHRLNLTSSRDAAGDLRVLNGSFLTQAVIDDASRTTDQAFISANTMLVTDRSSVLLHSARPLSIEATSVAMDSSVAFQFATSVHIRTEQALHIDANTTMVTSLLPNCSTAKGLLALESGGDVIIGGSVLVGSLFVAASNAVSLTGTVTAVNQPVADALFQPCQRHGHWQYRFNPKATTIANFTMVLAAGKSIMIGKSERHTLVQAGAALVCATDTITLTNHSIVSTNGMGGPADQGPGAGSCVETLGGGGGYGGRGADSSAVNEVGDYASGGLTYGTRSGAGMLGSGGGCVGGGSGGGIVMLGASGVVLDGQIFCNGLSGVNGGGGGSGGFLGLTVAHYLRGNGRISAVGGASQCVPASAATFLRARALESIDNDTGSDHADDGATATSLVCGGGGGGGRLQLDGCEENDFDTCTSGFVGNYTVHGGASSTEITDPGAADTGVAVLTNRAAGGTFFGFPCVPGHGGLFCRVCKVGTYKSESNSEECQACTNAPTNAHYVGLGTISADCDWTCNPGYSSSHCLSPLQQLLDACGGDIGFVVILLGIVGFFILIGYACRARKEPSHVRMYRGAGSKGERQHLLSSAVVGQRSRFAFLMRCFYWPRVAYPKLVERDLPEHMARIYFSGRNEPDMPLKLRTTVPDQLKSVLYDDEFQQFAEQLNAAVVWPSGLCGSWGNLIHAIVSVLCYPWASEVMAYRRHLRVNALKRIIGSYNHACMRGPRARALLNAVKLGYCGDYSIVYLELLYKESSQSACVPTTKIGKPALPLVLLFAGQGTYHAPYFLDPSDLLVRSVPQCPELTAFIDEQWIEFVAELNELLRVVQRDEATLVETLLPVAKFLERKMALATSGSGKHGGLRIYLGRFYVQDDMDCSEEFKLGIFLIVDDTRYSAPASGRFDKSTYGYNSGSYPRNLDTLDAYNKSKQTTAAMTVDPYDLATWNSSLRSGHSRRGSFGPTSSSSSSMKTTVSSIREEALRIRSSTAGSLDGTLPGLRPGEDAMLLGSQSETRRRRSFYEGWLGPVDASLPVPGVLTCADELEDRLADRPKRQLFRSLLQLHVLPRNVPRSAWLNVHWMLNAALLSLLMVDLAITFAMVVNLKCVSNGEVDSDCTASIMIPVFLFPPLVIVTAPVTGIISLALASTSFSRRYSVWNTLSMGNVLIVIFVCLTKSSQLVAPWFTAPVPLLPVIALVVKCGEAYVIERYIACQETHRRRRGWRGLMKRRLSDASIPPESP
ncbi:TPA: hypothetical protein N0F65_005620 [Lagenidium giganteum]|uniref:DUF8003 domain-containing protein n=1 Tax=Lagenidium giganteum TaxID=4803 RepID=A0AAV2YXK4_9STRA|nr:TPA: hypothetical protein N0F65_005620 [Lagenidium giganteum]